MAAKASKNEYKRYRVMYRPLYKFKDTITDIWAKNIDHLNQQLMSRGVKEVQYLYAHEYQEDGTVVEVITYERPKEEDKVSNKPRIKVKAVIEKALSLSGKHVGQGMYKAFEVVGA